MSNSSTVMKHPAISIFVLSCALASCGDSSKKSTTPGSPPIRTACTTPEQAGMKAADITRKLIELKKQGAINEDEYATFNSQMSAGFKSWAEKQDLRAYCAALANVVTNANLR